MIDTCEEKKNENKQVEQFIISFERIHFEEIACILWFLDWVLYCYGSRNHIPNATRQNISKHSNTYYLMPAYLYFFAKKQNPNWFSENRRKKNIGFLICGNSNLTSVTDPEQKTCSHERMIKTSIPNQALKSELR